MLTPELIAALSAPISETSPCGDDLEYDPAFTAMEVSAQGKPEQQFGDTVIPAVEPDWRQVAEQAEALLRRAKDVRPAVLLLRAATRQQGLAGLLMGLELVTGLLDRFWDGIYPKLDADDGDDPTMRLNALAPLTDETMLVRDLYEARIGTARGLGPLHVRDVAVAYNALAPRAGQEPLSQAQVNGALEEIRAEQPELAQTLHDARHRIDALQSLVNDRANRGDTLDLSPLRAIAQALGQAARTLGGQEAEAASGDAPQDQAAPPAGIGGDIRSRQDALRTLDRVIHYLRQAEPGNPAPLLIERAKQLIGVSFLDIIANLAPNALDAIETVTGRQASPQSE